MLELSKNLSERVSAEIKTPVYKCLKKRNARINVTSMLQNSCFYSIVPEEAITVAVCKYASFHSFCCLMNTKVKSFKQTVFLLE